MISNITIPIQKPKSISLYIGFGLFIILIIVILFGYRYYNKYYNRYYNKSYIPIPTTPTPTTPTPTTLIPTTPIPTTPSPTTPIPTTPIPTPSSLSLLFEGDWISYKIMGIECGPVNITANGPYSLYIYGINIPDDRWNVLTFDPNTLSCSLPKINMNNFGKAVIYGGRIIQIYGNQGVSLKRSYQTNITVSPITIDLFEGTWSSYIFGGREYGPVTILSTGQENSYYIYGGSIQNDNYRVLTVDPIGTDKGTTLSCSLPQIDQNNFGTAIIYGGKAIKIIANKGKGISFNRSNDISNVTVSPISTDPYEGIWSSYNHNGTEYGPVTILSTGKNSYYIYGGSIQNDNLRVLTVNPDTLSFSLPLQGINNFGTPLIYGGKALKIGEDNGTIFKRSKQDPNFTVSPTTTDPYEGIWSSYNHDGTEYGPVTILSNGQNSYYIFGGTAPDGSYYRVLTVDPDTLSFSLPIIGINNFGIPLMYGGKAIKIFGNKGISFNRSDQVPTVSPTTTDQFEGTWISYNYNGIEYGPVTILSNGKNKYYIYGENVQFNNQRVLTVDPDTLSCSLPEMGKNNFGIATIINGKAMKITGNQDITFKRLNETPSPITIDPFEGTWISYNYNGIEYGPVSILSTGQNSYKISGENIPDNNLTVLTFDPSTLYCSLPRQNKINFGIALIYGGKTIEIVSNEDVSPGITFKRLNDPPVLSPTTTDLFEGSWSSYRFYGTEYGPVTIIPIVKNKYYIYGGGRPMSIRMRILTVDPATLLCSLPKIDLNNFGKATITNGKAININPSNPSSITFTR